MRLPHDDRHLVALGEALEARGEVHAVAQHGVVQARGRADVARDHARGVEAHADLRDAGRPRAASAGPRRAHARRGSRARPRPRAARRRRASTGAPKTAITPSPRYLSTTPPCYSITSLISVRTRLSSCRLCCGRELLGERGEVAHVGEHHRRVDLLAAQLDLALHAAGSTTSLDATLPSTSRMWSRSARPRAMPSNALRELADLVAAGRRPRARRSCRARSRARPRRGATPGA